MTAADIADRDVLVYTLGCVDGGMVAESDRLPQMSAVTEATLEEFMQTPEDIRVRIAAFLTAAENGVES